MPPVAHLYFTAQACRTTRYMNGSPRFPSEFDADADARATLRAAIRQQLRPTATNGRGAATRARHRNCSACTASIPRRFHDRPTLTQERVAGTSSACARRSSRAAGRTAAAQPRAGGGPRRAVAHVRVPEPLDVGASLASALAASRDPRKRARACSRELHAKLRGGLDQLGAELAPLPEPHRVPLLLHDSAGGPPGNVTASSSGEPTGPAPKAAASRQLRRARACRAAFAPAVRSRVRGVSWSASCSWTISPGARRHPTDAARPSAHLVHALRDERRRNPAGLRERPRGPDRHRHAHAGDGRRDAAPEHRAPIAGRPSASCCQALRGSSRAAARDDVAPGTSLKPCGVGDQRTRSGARSRAATPPADSRVRQIGNRLRCHSRACPAP